MPIAPPFSIPATTRTWWIRRAFCTLISSFTVGALPTPKSHPTPQTRRSFSMTSLLPLWRWVTSVLSLVLMERLELIAGRPTNPDSSKVMVSWCQVYHYLVVVLLSSFWKQAMHFLYKWIKWISPIIYCFWMTMANDITIKPENWSLKCRIMQFCMWRSFSH